MNKSAQYKRFQIALLILFTIILNTGCARFRDLTEDKSYLTPVPQATLDAYRSGQPVKTRLESVIAAQTGIMTFHTDWVGKPTAIYAEAMVYKEAIRRTEQPGSTTYYDPTPPDKLVWLVVFEGMVTITGPLGTANPTISGCTYSVLDAKDGMGMIAGTLSCERLRLD